MRKTLLDIIVPVYGKNIEIIDNFLKKIISNANVSKLDLRFIIVYKNSNEFNYDPLLKYNNDFIVVKKSNKDNRRTNKIKDGISISNSKYLLFLDSHHDINFKKIKKFLKYLENNELDLVFLSIYEFNLDTNKRNVSKMFATTAGRYVIRSTMIKNHIEDLDFDVVFHDDWTMGLLFLFRNEIINSEWYLKPFYIKNYGSEVSNTKNKGDLNSALKKYNDSKIILKYFGKNIDIGTTYNITFWIMFYKLLNDCIRSYLIVNKSKINTIPKKDLLNILYDILDNNQYIKLLLFKRLYDINAADFGKSKYLLGNSNFILMLMEDANGEK